MSFIFTSTLFLEFFIYTYLCGSRFLCSIIFLLPKTLGCFLSSCGIVLLTVSDFLWRYSEEFWEFWRECLKILWRIFCWYSLKKSSGSCLNPSCQFISICCSDNWQEWLAYEFSFNESMFNENINRLLFHSFIL